jgi:hypothetical protein
MDTPPRREDNSNRLYDSDGYTDRGRQWKHLLKEQITEKDNAQKRSEGKTPLIRIDSNPTRMYDFSGTDDVSDAEISEIDEGNPLPRKRKRRRR